MRLFKGNIQAFNEILLILIKHRELVWEMAKRELSDRYAGQVFGFLWAVTHPIFIIGLYIFVFSFVFKMKLGGTNEMPLDYTTYMISGLVAWMSFQESMSKSCLVITSNSDLVKQVVFPLEILPVKSVFVSLFTLLISLTILIIYVLLIHKSLPWTYFLLLPLVLVQFLAMVGVAFILAPIGAYFKDIKDVVQLFSMMGMYLMPIFYLPNWVPDIFKPLLYLNPFSYLVWCYQDILYFGRFEHPFAWLVVILASFGIFVIGYRVFRKAKPALGDLL